MSKATKDRFMIFYSWQSDLPDETNRRLIREALRTAISLLETKFFNEKIDFILDEATRDEAGSPNIPLMILQKVRQADAFVCDITTINHDVPNNRRRVPNPNVIFELGYAVAHLGWSRIVMLFNKAYGNFPSDSPFDIDRHRASPYEYKISGDSDKKNNKSKLEKKKERLVKLLFNALKLVIEKNPIRADMQSDMTDDEKKRQRDLSSLNWILSWINIPTLDLHMNEAPHKIYDKIFFYWYSFDEIYSSSLFYLYDQKLRQQLKLIHDTWDESLSYGHCYHSPPHRDVFLFIRPVNRAFTDEEEAAWEAINKSVKKLRKALRKLLDHIKENYLQLDIDELSEIARQKYIQFHKDMNKRFKKN